MEEEEDVIIVECFNSLQTARSNLTNFLHHIRMLPVDFQQLPQDSRELKYINCWGLRKKT